MHAEKCRCEAVHSHTIYLRPALAPPRTMTCHCCQTRRRLLSNEDSVQQRGLVASLCQGLFTKLIVCNSHLPPLHHRPQLPVHPISRRLRSETLETVTIVERRRSNLARDMTSVLSACPSRTLCSCASCSVMVRIKSGALQPRTTATSTPP